MYKYLILFLVLSAGLHALNIEHKVDNSASSFTTRQEKKRVDVYDFSGSFPQLENIDIDAKRKKRVELYLTGVYPNLETLIYEGTFGSLKGELTGQFPKLKSVDILCTSCAMNFDLEGKWEKSCEINIRGMKEDICLTIPKDIGIIVRTRVGARGRVFAGDLKKKGWLGVLNKTYRNHLAETAEIVLTINIETSDGNIYLN